MHTRPHAQAGAKDTYTHTCARAAHARTRTHTHACKRHAHARIQKAAEQKAAQIEKAEAELGLPVVSSNQALLWHMLGLGGVSQPCGWGPGRLFREGALA